MNPKVTPVLLDVVTVLLLLCQDNNTLAQYYDFTHTSMYIYDFTPNSNTLFQHHFETILAAILTLFEQNLGQTFCHT
jgi:hypothetical protein